MRIESGDVGISATDLRALFDLYEITDESTRGKLTEDAKSARRQRPHWWTEPRYRAYLTPATVQLLQYQADAMAIRTYQNVLIPGILQNEAYAREVLRSGDLTDDDVEVRLEVRMRRAASVLDRPDPPFFYAILDESVLYREIGGPAVMGQQLLELLAHMKRPNVLVRIVPFAAAAPLALFGPFILIDLGDDDGSIVYREIPTVTAGTTTDEIVHTPVQVNRHKAMFEQLWERALGDDESRDLILHRAQSMLSIKTPRSDQGSTSPPSGESTRAPG
jgi:hypothetical protein